MSYTYEYPRPALTVDCVVFGLDMYKKELQLLLIKRGLAPFINSWALPGGFVQMNETLDEAALRELVEETGLKDIYLEQLYTFGKPDRDPRERVVSVAYYALVKPSGRILKADTDAREANWFAINNLPALAFDHQNIFETAYTRLKSKIRYQPLGFELLPEKFTLTQLQQLYELLLQTPLDKRNFRKKILSFGFLEELDEKEEGVSRRAARYWKFNQDRYKTLTEGGFNFEI